MSERRRLMIDHKKDVFKWVRLDDLKTMIGTFSYVNSAYVNFTTTQNYPIYAIAFTVKTPNDISDIVFFSTNPFLQDIEKSRICIWTVEPSYSELIQYRNESGTRSNYLSITDAGWESGTPIDVENRGTVTPAYIYYSADMSKCSNKDYLPGTLIYFVGYQIYANLSGVWVLIKQ